MATHTFNAQQMYTILADTMPTEGRDFTITTKMDKSGKLTVAVHPLTQVGRGFAPALVERLSAEMAAADVEFTSSPDADAEKETINTIRAKVELDAMTALQARLREAEKRYADTKDEISREDKERGRRALTNEESEKRARDYRAMQVAGAQRDQIKYTLEHIPEAREEIAGVSRAAAEADAKTGKDWAVDPDAPLTSLFDRKDAEDKLRQIEMYAQQLSAHMFMAARVKADAATVGKQYAIEK